MKSILRISRLLWTWIIKLFTHPIIILINDLLTISLIKFTTLPCILPSNPVVLASIINKLKINLNTVLLGLLFLHPHLLCSLWMVCFPLIRMWSYCDFPLTNIPGQRWKKGYWYLRSVGIFYWKCCPPNTNKIKNQFIYFVKCTLV